MDRNFKQLTPPFLNEAGLLSHDFEKELLTKKVTGGFQLEFVSISLFINHMTCYKFECSHWLKLQHSD
jgi:hypothetical protein